MKCQLFVSTLFAVLLTSVFTPQAEAIQAYALQSFSFTATNSLISFDTATPGVATTLPLSGATSSLDGIDFRPANGLLYGYSQASNQVFTIDPLTAVTTLVTTPATASTTSNLGIDFNPMADALRLVNTDDQNLAINVSTGATTVQTPLSYGGDDANIIDAAYTNNLPGAASTTIYYIDSTSDQLATAVNPGAGPFSTIGGFGGGITTNLFTGFDIYTTAGGVNTAFAILSDGNNLPSLYTLNLGSGAATLIGAVGSNLELFQVYSLAVVPVPEPSSLCLLTIAGAAAFRYRRRK